MSKTASVFRKNLDAIVSFFGAPMTTREKSIELNVQSLSGQSSEKMIVQDLIIAGWTGRDPIAVQHHIEELKALGVPPPKTTPIFYRVSSSRLNQQKQIEVIGQASSGEAECVLVKFNDDLLVGLGSDHTDREAETFGITLSKQMCDKPLGVNFWPYEEVVDHWDKLILRSRIEEAGIEVVYQDGPVSSLRSPFDLISKYSKEGVLPDGSVMFCGTHAAIGGIRPSKKFSMELIDPVLNRKLTHDYSTKSLVVEG